LLRKVVKDVLLSRIRDELHFSHEDVLSFKGLKRAVLRIDNDFWKRQQEQVLNGSELTKLYIEAPKARHGKSPEPIPSFSLTTTMVKLNNQNKSYATNACPPGPQATSTSVGESRLTQSYFSCQL